MTGELSEAEHDFIVTAETSLLRCINSWNEIDAELSDKQLLVCEAALFLKLFILITRDGLAVADGVMVARMLAALWDDDERPLP
jgi:hypothetical protein